MTTPQGVEALRALLELTEPLLKKFVWTAEKAGEVAAIVAAAKAALAVPALPVQPEPAVDSLREALALLIDVYDAMGAPRGPARIRAGAALVAHPSHPVQPEPEHPCEEAARNDLLDELEDARLELLGQHRPTSAAAIGKAIAWIQGEREEGVPHD
jgi:hypothetical protein